MTTIQLAKKQFNPKELLLSSPKRSDYSSVIREDCIAYPEGELPILSMKWEGLVIPTEKELLRCFEKIKYSESTRVGGLKTRSACLGSKPRVAIKNDYCSKAETASNYPLEHEIFLSCSRTFAHLYKQHFPDIFQNHLDCLNRKGKEIHKDYIIEGTPFTSGILNRDNALKYHRDGGNIKDTMSCMLVLKRDIVGGYLVLPEYDVAFELGNMTLFFFNGQKIIHGVTPFTKESKQAYRYSAVFYTMEKMWECLPIDKELRRIQEKFDRQFDEI